MDTNQSKNNLLVFLFLIFALEAILFYVGNFKLAEKDRLESLKTEEIKTILDGIPVLARAVSIYDITENKKIYGKNDNEILPPASLAKIMAVIVALNNYHQDNVISITMDGINQTGDYGLSLNEKWKIKDLAKFTLISSANDGAYALASDDENFLEKMNTKARKIGMENTSFYNFTGLDLDLERAGALATAEDVNTMALYARRAYPEIFGVTIMPEINLKSQSGFVHNFKNTNIIVDKIPGLLFSKTGFTEIAGGNLVIIFKDKKGDEIAITVLGSSFEGRFSDMEKIVNVLYNM